MTERIKNFLVTLFWIILVVGSFILFIYFIGVRVDVKCLEKYAVDYCNTENLSFDGVSCDGTPCVFYCKSPDYNPRTTYEPLSIRFFFLEEEKQICIKPFRAKSEVSK